MPKPNPVQIAKQLAAIVAASGYDGRVEWDPRSDVTIEEHPNAVRDPETNLVDGLVIDTAEEATPVNTPGGKRARPRDYGLTLYRSYQGVPPGEPADTRSSVDEFGDDVQLLLDEFDKKAWRRLGYSEEGYEVRAGPLYAPNGLGRMEIDGAMLHICPFRITVTIEAAPIDC